MKRCWIFILVVEVGFFTPSVRASTCSPASAVAHTFLEDRSVGQDDILKAANYLSGIDKIRAIKRFRMSVKGYVSNGLQGYDPVDVDLPKTRRAFGRLMELDLHNQRHRRVTWLRFDGATVRFTDGYANGRLWTASDDNRIAWTRNGTETSFLDSSMRYVPAFIVLHAVDHLATAAALGDGCVAGSATQVVDFSWNEQMRLRMNLDRDTGRIVRLKTTTSDPLMGDDNETYDFDGQQITNGISFPLHITYGRHGFPFTVSTVDAVEVNPELNATLFDPPKGYAEAPTLSQARRIGEGAYEMSLGDGPDNFVEFFDLGNKVIVFDAPLDSDTSSEVVAEIKRLLGNKPITHVIISHFHDDHAGGVGYYAALGATIVTTRDSAAVLSRYAHAASHLNHGSATIGRPLKFAFVDGSPVTLAGAGERSLIVYRLNNLPHVNAMLVAYATAAKVIANSDLYAEFAPFDTNMLLFAKWLASTEAPPDVQWIAGGHHRPISRVDFMNKSFAFEHLQEQHDN